MSDPRTAWAVGVLVCLLGWGCEAEEVPVYVPVEPAGDMDASAQGGQGSMGGAGGDISVGGREDARPPRPDDPGGGGAAPAVDCTDADGDGFGVGAECDRVDCDDTRADAHPEAAETCAGVGVDEDCDGAADEGCECRPGDALPCGRDEGACRAGTQRCVEGSLGPCEGAVDPRPSEVCDGVDDDCDGRVDEAFDVGDACTVGQGACGRDGVRICDDAGEGTRCDATPGAPRAETCDGSDEDCDGAVDEDACDPACAGRADGTEVVGPVEGPCEGFVEPCGEEGVQPVTRTVCRGGRAEVEVDDQPCRRDTEGTTVSADAWDACLRQGGACSGAGRQSRGVERCRGGRLVDDAETRDCRADPDRRAEQCNGEDDDCDGRTDEGLDGSFGGFGGCGGFGGDCDESGTQSRTRRVCQGGRYVDDDESRACSRSTDGSRCDGGAGLCDNGQCQRCGAEQCNGEDDDCDGRTDEGLDGSFGAWGGCGGFGGDCDESGTQSRTRRVCRGGRYVDDDESRACGRSTDGSRCDGGAGLCDNGQCQRCGAESCNGEDDDCDGRTDEGLDGSFGGWSGCGGFGSDCDESGTQSRTRRVCQGGRYVDDDESRACGRSTDGDRCGNQGTCDDGVCREVCEVRTRVSVRDDTFVDSGQPNENFNGQGLIFGNNAAGHWAMYLRFDDPFARGVPRGAQIDRVELCFDGVIDDVTGGTSIEMCVWDNEGGSCDDWREGSLTHNGSGVCRTGDRVGCGTYRDGFPTYCIEITGTELDEIDYDGVVVGQRVASGRSIVFFDSETNAARAPWLNVRWTGPCP